MTLQQAIDILHQIREQFPHVVPLLTVTDRQFRNGQPVYIIECYQGTICDYKRSWVISSPWDWQEFLLLFAIFSNK